MTSGEMTAFIGALTAPIVAYLKIQSDRKTTGQERDTTMALMKQEIDSLKESIKLHSAEIGTLTLTCNEIRLTLREISTVLTFFKAHMDAEDKP